MLDPLPDVVPDELLDDLHRRLRATRRIPDPWREDARRGIPARELDELLEFWATDYDWRASERRIRSLPWVLVATGGSSMRMIHRPCSNPSAPVVVLLHGWPDSVLRFERVLPLLDDVHVVVPALPGFPFAPALPAPTSSNEIAELLVSTLDQLGYRRFVVSGGDVGAPIAEVMSAAYPDRVAALHLTNLAASRAAMADPARLPADAIAYLDHVARWRSANGAFAALQATRPSTLATALGDSPAGLLAWMGEKLLDWSDAGDAAAAFSPDELLTWVSTYWFSGAIGTSFSTYATPARLPDRLTVPTVFSAFGSDIMPAPRGFVEAFAADVRFVEHANGGHFAARDRPQDYVDDLRLAIQGADRGAL